MSDWAGLPVKKRPRNVFGSDPGATPCEPAAPAADPPLNNNLESKSEPQPEPPVPMTYTMRGFVENYYRKYSRPTHESHRSTMQWLRNFTCGPKEANLTVFEGGKYFVPRDQAPVYYKHVAIDIHARQLLSLNEMTAPGEIFATLAIELDYRFPSIERVPTDDVFMAHIRLAHATVLRYYETERNSLRLMLFRCAPKPKLSGGTYVCSVGFHMIYNRLVKIVDGAQISHAVHIDLTAHDAKLKDVVDNVYVKGRGYVERAALRPPYAAKRVDCYFCSDRAQKRQKVIASQAIDDDPEFAPKTIQCGMCNSESTVLDANVYHLYKVWDAESAEDDAMFNNLSKNITLQLRMASIWGYPHSQVPPREMKDEPRYTVFEMTAGRQPTAKAQAAAVGTMVVRPEAQRGHTGKVLRVRADLVSFGMMHVKSKHDKGIPVPHESKLNTMLKAALAVVSVNYATCNVGALTSYRGSQALRVNMTGPGATFCLVKNEMHNSNRAVVWFVADNDEPRCYAGCYSDNCMNQFSRVITLRSTVIQEIMSFVKRRLGGPALENGAAGARKK